MNEEKKKIEFKVKLNLDADDWQLYSQMKGVKAVARKLNKEIAEALNNGDYSAAEEIMLKYSDYGAYDSPPLSVLRGIARRMHTQ